jgi:guanylate kinase
MLKDSLDKTIALIVSLLTRRQINFIIFFIMKRGLLVILSGPSGVGKGTIRKRIMQEPSLSLAYSVSMTTRPIRMHEEEGKDYFFVSKQRFLEAIEKNELIEWAEFVGNRYGTPKAYVEQLRNEGKNVFLEIEIDGASQVIAQYAAADLITIFLMPPSFEDLETRIRKRQTETEDVIFQRLKKAKREMSLYKHYQYVVVNDQVDRAVDEIIHIISHRMALNQPS